MDTHELIEFLHNEKFEALWGNLAELLQHYFRVDVEGVKNLPKSGSAIITPNHSGYAGTDVIVLSHIINQAMGRHPRILAHRAYFDFSELETIVSKSFGLRLASIRSGVNVLKEEELLMIFPEGSAGNFKSSLKAYQLQDFHTGFLRMAIAAKAPIVPAVVIGAEESHLNWGSIDFGRFFPGYRLPVPLSLLPLPAKWKIRFLSPMDFSDVDPDTLHDREAMEKLAKKVRMRMQRIVNNELKKREFVFHPKLF